jgi:hypothetical protein
MRQRHRNTSVGEHRPLTIWFNDHDDGGAATRTLERRLNACTTKCRL